MRRLIYLFLLLLTISFSSCEKKESLVTPIPTVEDYFPLKVGNSWTYDLFNLVNGEAQYSGTETLSIIDKKQIGGKVYFEFDVPSALSSFFFKFLRSDGSQLLDHHGNVSLRLEQPETVFTRDTFFIGSPAEPLVIMSRQVLLDTKDIKVVAGDFVCLEVATEVVPLEPGYPGGIRNYQDYFAEDIGLVQANRLFYVGNAGLEIRLNAFDLK